MKILLEYTNSIYPVRQIAEGPIKLIDKKIVSIAILLFSCLAASAYYLYCQYENKKMALSLKNLKGLSYDQNSKKLTLKTDQKIDKDLKAVFKFYPSVEVLELDGCTISEEGMKLLPKTLTKLILIEVNVSDKALSKMPQNLESLKIEYSVSEPQTLTNKAFQSLPPNLKDLTLNIHYPKNLTNEVFKSLPLNLIYLDVTFFEKITEEALNHKLPELKYLYFNCPKANVLNFKNLPRTMLRISLYRADPKNLADIPPKLKSLFLENCSLTDDQLNQLPYTLTNLSLNDCPLVTKEGINKFINRPIDPRVSINAITLNPGPYQ